MHLRSCVAGVAIAAFACGCDRAPASAPTPAPTPPVAEEQPNERPPSPAVAATDEERYVLIAVDATLYAAPSDGVGAIELSSF